MIGILCVLVLRKNAWKDSLETTRRENYIMTRYTKEASTGKQSRRPIVWSSQQKDDVRCIDSTAHMLFFRIGCRRYEGARHKHNRPSPSPVWSNRSHTSPVHINTLASLTSGVLAKESKIFGRVKGERHLGDGKAGILGRAIRRRQTFHRFIHDCYVLLLALSSWWSLCQHLLETDETFSWRESEHKILIFSVFSKRKVKISKMFPKLIKNNDFKQTS